MKLIAALALLALTACNGLPEYVTEQAAASCERGPQGQRGPAGRNAPMVTTTHVERDETTVAYGTARELYVECRSGVALSGGCIGDDIVVSVPWQVETDGEVIGWLCTGENRLYEQPSYLAAHVLCTGDEPDD